MNHSPDFLFEGTRDAFITVPLGMPADSGGGGRRILLGMLAPELAAPDAPAVLLQADFHHLHHRVSWARNKDSDGIRRKMKMPAHRPRRPRSMRLTMSVESFPEVWIHPEWQRGAAQSKARAALERRPVTAAAPSRPEPAFRAPGSPRGDAHSCPRQKRFQIRACEP